MSGNYLSKPALKKVVEESDESQSNAFKYGASSMQGWTKYYEDRVRIFKRIEHAPFKGCWFFGVFDGHAGFAAAQFASEKLIEKIIGCSQHLKSEKQFDPEKIKEAIQTAFLQTDDFIKEELPKVIPPPPEKKPKVEGQEDYDEDEEQDTGPKEDKSGSTAVCVIISKTHFFVANCGDSRAVLSFTDLPTFKTMDHKPTLPAEKQRIIKAGSVVVNNRVNASLAVSRALGDFDYKGAEEVSQIDQAVSPFPDVTIIPRSGTEELLILACDGIWDVMDSEDSIKYVRYLLKTKKDIKEVSNALIETCLYKGSRDNLTAIVVAFNGNAPVYDEKVAKKDAELEREIREAVQTIVENNPSVHNIPDLNNELNQQTFNELPPGGGLASKRHVIEEIFFKLRPPVETTVAQSAVSPMSVDASPEDNAGNNKVEAAKDHEKEKPQNLEATGQIGSRTGLLPSRQEDDGKHNTKS